MHPGERCSGYYRPLELPCVNPMLPKIVIVVLLLAIVATLFTSMTFLVRDESSRKRTLTALKIRVALSITLIVFVVVAYLMGWIHPHPVVPPGQ